MVNPITIPGPKPTAAAIQLKRRVIMPNYSTLVERSTTESGIIFKPRDFLRLKLAESSIPTSLLCETLTVDRPARLWGICPESLLCDKSSDSSCVRFARDEGMLPVKQLLDRFSTIRSFTTPIDSGIFPLSLFRTSKEEQSERDLGSFPTNWLWPTFSDLRLVITTKV